MVVTTDTVDEDFATGFMSVCADPGVTGNIARPAASSYTLTFVIIIIVKLKLSLTFDAATVL